MLYVVTGPESSGKTTLATELSVHFSMPLVAEQARAYLSEKPGYLPSDLLHLAQLQMTAEQLHAEECTKPQSLVFADTDLQVLYIWWRELFATVPRSLVDAYHQQSQRCYLLCEPDLIWEADPLRENRYDRDRLYELYRTDLDRRNLPYSVIRGTGEERLNAALLAIANDTR